MYSGGAKWLFLDHEIYEKIGMDGLCKKKAKKIIIMVKYRYTEHVIIIIGNVKHSNITFK